MNDCDIRRYHPTEYHQHVTAVFQGFSKFNASVKENIGIGYVPDIGHYSAIERAAELAGAAGILCSLPKGLKTTLDSGYAPASTPADSQEGSGYGFSRTRHGLSGGEVCTVRSIAYCLALASLSLCESQWQRIAISRAFMRAHRPEVELLVFDEPVRCPDRSNVHVILSADLIQDILIRCACSESYL